jgi:head-tail adaptor
MQAGLLRDFIEVYRQSVTKNPTNGETIISWEKAWRGRARVEFSSGTQMVENNETINTITRKVTIRTKPVFSDKLTTLRIKIGSDYYRILSRDIRDTDMATIMIVELINE